MQLTCNIIAGLTIAILGGTGRMGVHLSAAWANAGLDVTMCSRRVHKAQAIIDELLAGRGYLQPREEALEGGGIMVPPHDASGWKLKAGTVEDAAKADVIVLGVMYEKQWEQLGTIAELIRGKGKIILDMTNPWIPRPDGYGQGIPPEMPQAAVLVHQRRLRDPTTRWVAAYKHVLWALILPDGPKSPQNGDGVEVYGEPTAVEVVSALIRAHGWRPVPRGGLEVAEEYELFGPRRPAQQVFADAAADMLSAGR